MAEVGALRVTLGLDSADFTRSLAEINRKLKAVESEFKAAGGSIKGFENTLEGLQAKSDMLTRKIALQSARVQELKRRYEESAATKGKEAAETEKLLIQYNKAVGELKKLENELQQTSAKLDKLSRDVNQNITVWDKMHAKLNEVGQRMQDLGGRLQSAGQGIAMSFGAVTTAIGGALGFAVKKSMDFEAQIDRVGAIAGATPAELEKLKKSALDLGASTSKSATEVAQAQEIMATMGYKTNQIIAAMPGVIAAAEASGEDMALVADTVSAALNAFGLSADKASKVADVLAQAANDSAAGIQDMQYTFKYAAPIANQLGISLEQLAAATEIMANNGIKGEQAGTTLRAALIRLSDPPREAANVLDHLGVKITDASGKMLPFGNIIGQLAEKTKNMSNAQKLAALSTIFGTEAASGMLTVVEAGPQKLDSLTKSLQNSAGASQEAAQKMKDNLKGALENLSGAFETAQITIGNALAPAIQKIAEVLQGLIDRFNQLSPSTQRFIAIGAAVTAVLTGMVATFGVILALIGGAVNGFGALSGAFSSVAQAISKAGGMMGVLRTALAALTGPIGITIAAVTGLIAIFVALYRNNETFRNKVNQIWQQIKNMFQQVLTAIGSVVRSSMSAVTSFFSSKLQQIRQFWQENGDQIQKVMSVVMTAIATLVKVNMALIQAGITVAWNVIKAVTSSVWGTIKGIISGGLNVILGVIKTFVSILTGDWRGAWEGLKQTVKGALQAIGALSTMMIDIGRNIISGMIKGLVSAAKGLYEKAKEIANGVLSTIKKALDIHSPSRETEKLGKYTGEGFAKGIESKTRDVENAAKNSATAAKHAFENAFRNIQYRFDAKQINAKQAINEFENLKKQYAKVPNAVERVNKEIYKIQQKYAKQLADANKKAFNEAFAKAQTNFKLGKINSSQYISELRKIQQEYAKLPEQVRKVQLEIKKVEDKRAKEQAALAKKQFEDAKKAIEDKRALGQLSLDQELKAWQALAKKYKDGSKERIEIEKQIVRVKNELLKQQFENEKAYIDKRKYYNDLSLKEELELYESYIKKYKKGTEEREYYEREIYRVKKEINDKLLEANNEYAQQVKEINERLQQDELKAKEEYEQKVKEINDRLAEDERRLTEEYQKAVDDRTKSLYSFAGLFDEFKRKNDVTGQGLLKNLSDQVSAFKDWQANIVSLANRGIDEGLLQELRDMGPKAVDEIAALNSLSDTELQQYVQLWREKNALARTQAINELEGMRMETQLKIQQLRATANAELEQAKTEYVNKIAQLRAQATAELEQHKNEWLSKVKEISEGTTNELNLMSASMADIGKNSMQGLIDGLNSMMGPLRQKAQEIANVVQATIKNALKIKSPSRVMMELGGWIPIGIAEGISRNISAVVSATNRMAQATIPGVPGMAVAGGYGAMQTNHIAKYGNVNINVTIPVNDLEQIRTVNDFFNRLGMKVKQA